MIPCYDKTPGIQQVSAKVLDVDRDLPNVKEKSKGESSSLNIQHAKSSDACHAGSTPV